jgi:hypothetical protein
MGVPFDSRSPEMLPSIGKEPKTEKKVDEF